MNKLTLTALAATALFTAPALAQTNANPPMANAPAAGAPTTLSQQQVDNLWRATKLDGVNIYNNNNEKIGEIGDILIDHTGKAVAAVVDVGGFLGMGEHRVALKFEDLKFSDAPRSSSASKANNTMNTASTTTGAADRAAPAGAPPTTVSTNANNTASASASHKMYPDHAILNMTKDQLKALPQISYSR